MAWCWVLDAWTLARPIHGGMRPSTAPLFGTLCGWVWQVFKHQASSSLAIRLCRYAAMKPWGYEIMRQCQLLIQSHAQRENADMTRTSPVANGVFQILAAISVQSHKSKRFHCWDPLGCNMWLSLKERNESLRDEHRIRKQMGIIDRERSCNRTNCGLGQIHLFF